VKEGKIGEKRETKRWRKRERKEKDGRKERRGCIQGRRGE